MKKHIQITCLLLTLFAGTAYAQGYGERQQKAFEAALLDSAYKFELLKPVLFKLQTAYELRNEENQALRLQIIDMRMQSEVREKWWEQQFAEERSRGKKKFKRGLTIGGLAGFGLGILTH